MTRNIILLLAVLLLLACQERKTDRAEEFREAIHQKDSIITFSTLNVEDEKRHFVFEKQEKYQTMGYWVLPAYKGSKERFTFFPEVEESGKMLLVNIDGKRRYTFTEVNLDSSDYQSLLPTGLSARQRDDVHRCFTFAKAMHDLDIARKTREKTLTKIRFFERKMKK